MADFNQIMDVISSVIMIGTNNILLPTDKSNVSMKKNGKKSREIPGENDGRRYQRYALSDDGDAPAQVEVIIDGEPVRLVNFSVGGLYVLSRTPFSPGTTISFSVNFENRGKIDLDGTVVRVVREEGDIWGIAIDLSKTYNLNTLRKL